MSPSLADYRQLEVKLTGSDIFKLRDATSRIQRITADCMNHRINESAAIDLIRQIIEYLRPIVKMYDKPLMLWPLPVRELLQAIKQSGVNIPFVESMFHRQEITTTLIVKQPQSTNIELVDSINQTRTATIAAATESAVKESLGRLKINLDQAKERLVIQEHIHEPDQNNFFVVWDNETNQEVSKRIFYKELLKLNK
jgi:hypothetical protein